MDIKHAVFAGQVFAEMLAGICHEEFYKYSDQEVIPYPYVLINRHLQYLSHTLHFNCTMRPSRRVISDLFTMMVLSRNPTGSPCHRRNYMIFANLLSGDSGLTFLSLLSNIFAVENRKSDFSTIRLRRICCIKILTSRRRHCNRRRSKGMVIRVLV